MSQSHLSGTRHPSKGVSTMSVIAASARSVKKWRVIVFAIVAVLAGLVYLTDLPLALSPWFPALSATMYGYPYPELNQWHNTIQGVVSSLLLSGILLALLWQP